MKGHNDFLFYWFSFLVGIIFACILITHCFTLNLLHYPKDYNIVSYEYTTKCRCGGTIEGYESKTDSTILEECKSCGYHKEVIGS